MADRRRRRKRASQDSEEEDESGSGTESGGSGSAGGKTRITVPEPVVVPTVRIRTKSEEESECESEDAIGEAVLSDYESADPEDNGSHSEGEEEEEVVEGEKFSDEEGSKQPEPKSDTDKLAGDLVVEEEEEEDEEEVEEVEEDEEGGGKEVKSDKKGNLAGERQSGDGQESTDDPENKSDSKAGKKLDDDEDRKNPAYIPRKGLFFEHDVRGQAHEEDIRPKGRHRKLWKDEGRWEHDKFREDEQAPKSREELIAMYGYDIRNANGPCDGRPFRSRKPRYSSSPGREKRWRDGEKLSRSSWHCSGNSGTTTAIVQSSSVASPSGPVPPLPRIQGGGGRTSSHPQTRNFQGNRPPQTSYRSYKPLEENSHQHNSLQHQGVFGRGSHKHHPEMEQIPGRRGREAETEHSPAVVVEDERYTEEEPVKPQQQQQQPSYYSVKLSERDPLPNRRREDTQSEPALLRDTTPATATAPERTVERKSYSLARRTRTKPSELGKQVSLEESVPPVPPPAQPALSTEKNEAWETREESSGVQGGLTGLDQDLARLSLAGQNWAQSPPSYLRAEMRGIPNSIHMAGGPPQYNRMEEMGVGGGRAKRYSSQRQRPVPEPAPMHIGIMEGHYYEPMSFQGPIYAHSDSPTPLAPQGMLVQPEMHLTHPGHPGHPGLHPHQSGAPMPNPAMYAGPPVSMSPGQPPPQQLLAPPFYPPPGVMTFGNTNFPYAAGATLPPIYPNPQAQAQVYGGVTYYDTMQQQAQPKPSPPRRSSQPVTIKPPPPEGEKSEKVKDKTGS